jgi:anti-anti-sigma regulatory factor
VLKRVNQALTAERVGSGLFLTAAYCVLDVETGEARFAAAGHPPVVWRKASGEVHRITRTGPVLGITAEANYREVSAQIGKDDRLLFFTDGLLQRDEAGQWRAIETSLALTEADGRAVLQSLMDSTQPDNEDRDDMTLLLLQASPGVSHFNNVGAATAEGAVPVAGTAAGREAVVWYGETADESFLQVRGRGTWMDCDAFYDTAHAIAEDLRPVVVDLSTCEYLDSTFLGTIHELVSTDRVRVQGLTPSVRATFEELDMQQVLRSADGPHTPLPNEMQPLNSLSGAMTSSQKRILRAHETLASLSERNREKFRGVVDAMRAM